MSFDSIFADTHSELSESDTYGCSDPKCDWPGECQGNHGYSNNRDESTVEWKKEVEDTLKGDVIVDQASPKVSKANVDSGDVSCGNKGNWDLENSGESSVDGNTLKGDVDDELSVDEGTLKDEVHDESSADGCSGRSGDC